MGTVDQGAGCPAVTLLEPVLCFNTVPQAL